MVGVVVPEAAAGMLLASTAMMTVIVHLGAGNDLLLMSCLFSALLPCLSFVHLLTFFSISLFTSKSFN